MNKILLSGGNFGGWEIEGNKAYLYDTDGEVLDTVTVTKKQGYVSLDIAEEQKNYSGVYDVQGFLYSTTVSPNENTAEFIGESQA